MDVSRRFRPAWVAIVLAVIAGMIGATPAYAITGGQPDGGGHPQVGLIIDWTTRSICSGTLISETVVLTAGHCTIEYGATSNVVVTFDSIYSKTGTFYAASGWETHPSYDATAWPWTVDVGVVYLAEPASVGAVGGLPDALTLDSIIPDRGASKQVFTDVGYGQTGVDTSGPGRPTADFPLERRVSWQKFHPGQNEWVGAIHGYDEFLLQLKASPSSQHGSGCGGDSGGPIFLGDTATIVAIHTGGYRLGVDGSICGRISSLNHRIDTPIVLDWLYQFI